MHVCAHASPSSHRVGPPHALLHASTMHASTMRTWPRTPSTKSCPRVKPATRHNASATRRAHDDAFPRTRPAARNHSLHAPFVHESTACAIGCWRCLPSIARDTTATDAQASRHRRSAGRGHVAQRCHAPIRSERPVACACARVARVSVTRGAAMAASAVAPHATSRGRHARRRDAPRGDRRDAPRGAHHGAHHRDSRRARRRLRRGTNPPINANAGRQISCAAVCVRARVACESDERSMRLVHTVCACASR